jgi:hypothetical protein
MDQDAKSILEEWQSIARKLDREASFILRQRELAGSAIPLARFLVQHPDDQPTMDKLAELKNTFLAAREEDVAPFPDKTPEVKKDQKLSVTRSIQYAEDAIKFNQDVLAKLKQIETAGHEQAQILLREIEELRQTRRKFINNHVANTSETGQNLSFM